MAVYFLRPIGLTGPVKIGHGYNPEARLTSYLNWSPLPLEIAAIIRDGDLEMEARFHALLWDHHSHGEWFKGAPAVRRVVQAVREDRFDFDALPLAGRRPPGRIKRDADSTRATVANKRLYKLAVAGVPIPPAVRDAEHGNRFETLAERRARQAIVWTFVDANWPLEGAR